jgi:hypothetical protein
MIRPGMTVRIRNYAPDFNGYYIITSVEWSEDEPGPVKLEFRTPEFPKKNSSANNSSGDEGTSTVTSQSRQDNLDFIASYIGREAVVGFSDKDDAFVQNYVDSIVQASETANQAFTDWMKD